MHTIRTFVVRLLVDPAEPEVLRGAIQPVPEGTACSFDGEEMLLALLKQMIAQAAEADGDRRQRMGHG